MIKVWMASSNMSSKKDNILDTFHDLSWKEEIGLFREESKKSFEDAISRMRGAHG